MKQLILIFAFVLFCSTCWADVTSEIMRTYEDPIRPGIMIVETEYYINGVFEQLGRARYKATSGTDEFITKEAKRNIKQHRANLTRRITANADFIRAEKQKRIDALDRPMADMINGTKSLVGYTDLTYEVTDEYKGKDIKVTTDSKNTVSDTVQ